MTTTAELWGLVLLAGLWSFLSPCVLPLVPAYLAALTLPGSGPAGWRSKLARTSAFAAGVCFPFFLVGLFAGSALAVLDHPAFLLLAGLVVAGFGLGRLLRPARSCQAPPDPAGRVDGRPGGFWRRRPSWTVPGAFGLGLASSFGWTSCSAPLLAAILALSVGRTGLGGPAVLLALYGLGVTWPFFLLSMGAHGLGRRLGRAAEFRKLLERLGSLAMIGLGLWLIWGNRGAATLWGGG